MQLSSLGALTQAIDTTALVDSLLSVPIRYTLSEAVVSTSPESVTIGQGIVEYLFTLVIVLSVSEILKYYRRQIVSIIRAMTSRYMMNRMLDTLSILNSQLFVYVSLLKSALLSIIISELYTPEELLPEVLLGFPSYYYPIAYLVFLLLINLFVLLGSRWCRLLARKGDFYRIIERCTKFFFLTKVVDALVLLMFWLTLFILPQEAFLVAKYIFASGAFVGLVMCYYYECNFFYKADTTFLQFILYFCAVKSLNSMFIVYLIWSIF